VPAGLFISFEGIDGSGKSTQVDRLVRYLESRKRPVVAVREPGGTPLGERLREILLQGGDLTSGAEASLFAAARAELVHNVIRPALADGTDVVCDRYLDSSLVYQGFARGVDVDKVYSWNREITDGLEPDRTFLLLLAAEDATTRIGKQLRLFPDEHWRGPPDRLERESYAFRRLVDDAYRALPERFPARICAIDGTRKPSEIAKAIRNDVRAMLERAPYQTVCA
jgi:dTMP kinase